MVLLSEPWNPASANNQRVRCLHCQAATHITPRSFCLILFCHLFPGLWDQSSAKQENQTQVSFLSFVVWKGKYALLLPLDVTRETMCCSKICACDSQSNLLMKLWVDSKIRQVFWNVKDLSIVLHCVHILICRTAESVLNLHYHPVWINRWSLKRVSIPAEHHERDVTIRIPRLAE